MSAPDPWGIEHAREKLAAGVCVQGCGFTPGHTPPCMTPAEAHPESDLALLRLELDACHQEITRLRFVLGQVADALSKADEQ